MTFHSGMAKRLAILCSPFLLVPLAMWAGSSQAAVAFRSPACVSAPGSICLASGGGTAVGSTTDLDSDGIASGSVASTVTGVGGLRAAGTLEFSTPRLISGWLSTGGVFEPGRFTIKVSDWNSFPGVLFSGTFPDPMAGIPRAFTGTSGSGSNRRWNYTLTGAMTGTWYSGAAASGSTAQLLGSSKTADNREPLTLNGGTTSVLTPELASIGLLGTGLLLMGFLVRRRVKRYR